MASPRAVRIPRSRPTSAATPAPTSAPSDQPDALATPPARRANVAGSQRAVRLTILFVVVLALLYASFVLYDRTAPGGTASAEDNGILLLSVLFVVFALGGAIFTLTPAPRRVEVEPDRLVVVGRWGRRRTWPPLDQLSVYVARRYPAGWLASGPVELVELSADGVPRQSYLIEAGLFEGARPSTATRR